MLDSKRNVLIINMLSLSLSENDMNLFQYILLTHSKLLFKKGLSILKLEIPISLISCKKETNFYFYRNMDSDFI